MKYIGIDLGGTNIVTGLIDEDGTIIKSLNRPTLRERDAELIFDDIVEMCKELIDEFKLDASTLKGIGIGVPGSVDKKSGRIVYANNLKTSNFNVKEYLKDKLDYPVKLGNDADCAALGEVVAGSAKGYSDVIIFTLGTGVGGGITINGEIFSGYYPGGAEIGHIIIERNGRQCTCGNKGCLETYASATGLIRSATEKALANPDSLLYKMTEGNMEKMNAKIPFDAAQAGDAAAQEVIDTYIEYLAIGIANIINVFKPQVILLGGGVSKQEENLTVPLAAKVKTMAYGGEMPTLIKTASLGNDAGLIGAAMLNK